MCRPQGTQRPGFRRHPQRCTPAGQHLPPAVRRRRRCHRHPRPAPASFAPRRRQPHDRVRVGREGRPADARSRLRHHERWTPTGTSSRIASTRWVTRWTAPAEPPESAARAWTRCPVCPRVARARFGAKYRRGPSQRFRWSWPLSYLYPRRDSNPRYRLESPFEE